MEAVVDTYIYAIFVPFSGPEVLFKTCVAIKFVDDGDDTYLNC